MLTVVVGLVAALTYGSADFLGGIASKRMSPIRVTAIGAASGLVVLFAATPFIGGRWSWSIRMRRCPSPPGSRPPPWRSC
jgi:hypothetical protein